MKYLLKNQETERIFFRKVALSDFDSWLKFHEDPITSQHWLSEKESPKIECENWYKNQLRRYQNDLGGMNALIEKSTGRLIGHCGLLVQDVDDVPELEIAYSLLPKFWNQGLATESAQKCRDFAFENNLSESLISIVSLTNLASEKVALHNGMNLDNATMYRGNEVNIFRIYKNQWLRMKTEVI